MSSPIFDALNNFIDNLPGAKRIWIAYSGGVDSHVLLYALTEMRKNHTQLNLSAIHINHGLSNNADQWTHHCEQICHHLNIPCQTIHVNVNSIKGESLEALARNARYQAFAELLTPQDILLTAHHLNDQAETCFLQFLRGSGPKGLASMPAITQFAQGTLMRPFLSISRQESRAFLP